MSADTASSGSAGMLAHLMPGSQPITFQDPATVQVADPTLEPAAVLWRNHCIGVLAYARATGDYRQVSHRHVLGCGLPPMAHQRPRDLPQAMG